MDCFCRCFSTLSCKEQDYYNSQGKQFSLLQLVLRPCQPAASLGVFHPCAECPQVFWHILKLLFYSRIARHGFSGMSCVCMWEGQWSYHENFMDSSGLTLNDPVLSYSCSYSENTESFHSFDTCPTPPSSTCQNYFARPRELTRETKKAG